ERGQAVHRRRSASERSSSSSGAILVRRFFEGDLEINGHPSFAARRDFEAMPLTVKMLEPSPRVRQTHALTQPAPRHYLRPHAIVFHAYVEGTVTPLRTNGDHSAVGSRPDPVLDRVLDQRLQDHIRNARVQG